MRYYIGMIDDLKYIHEKDQQDALGVAEKQWQQLAYDYEVKPNLDKPAHVVVAGMGGSALAASLLGTWPKLPVPFEVVRNYAIPDYVSEQTLFIASSYSGNTEESLEALQKAIDKKAQIIVISSGGKLAELAEENDYPLYRLPEGFQPRMAVFYNLAALVQICESAQLVNKGITGQLRDSADWLRGQIEQWLPTVPAESNQAKQIARELMGKSPVVYAGPELSPAAYKWKISFNENAKNVAWYGQLPEFNHNEFLGWSSHPLEKPYAVIDLRSNLEHPQVLKRFEVSERLLSGKRPAPIVVEAQGEDILRQLLWTVALGDFVSLYLSLLNGLNPTPVELIEKLKKEL